MKRLLGIWVVVAALAVQLPEGASADAPPPIVIHELGTAPVAANISSTAQLRAHASQLLAAAGTLHLSEGEMDALRAALTDDSRVFEYGPIPRRLDAMTSNGAHGYYAMHDVVIPPNQYGWQLAYSHDRTRTVFYIPNRCGNVSIVRTRLPLAAVPGHAAPVAAAAPVVAATPPPIGPAATPTPAPIVAASPTPAPNDSFWHRYRVGFYIIGACVLADLIAHKPYCGFGPPHGGSGTPPHPKVTPPPHHQPTPSPSTRPSPTPMPSATPRPTPTPISTPTPKPSATASCPPATLTLTGPGR